MMPGTGLAFDRDRERAKCRSGRRIDRSSCQTDLLRELPKTRITPQPIERRRRQRLGYKKWIMLLGRILKSGEPTVYITQRNLDPRNRRLAAQCRGRSLESLERSLRHLRITRHRVREPEQAQRRSRIRRQL